MYNMILFCFFYQKEKSVHGMPTVSYAHVQRASARFAILTIFYDTHKDTIYAFTICSLHIIMFDFLST